MRLWDTARWKERNLLQAPGEVLSLAYSPDGQSLVAGCWDGSLRAWSCASVGQSSPPAKFQLTFSKNVITTAFTGRVFVIASKPTLADGPPRQTQP